MDQNPIFIAKLPGFPPVIPWRRHGLAPFVRHQVPAAHARPVVQPLGGPTPEARHGQPGAGRFSMTKRWLLIEND